MEAANSSVHLSARGRLTTRRLVPSQAGIIGLPYALASAGLVTGLFLLVSLCLVTDWTIRLIVLNAKLSGRNSYIEVSRRRSSSNILETDVRTSA